MDTIFAPATPPGRSGVAVLRISGARAGEVFSFFSLPPPSPRTASLVRLVNPLTGDPVDRALALYFPAPASFTGEDVVELHLHGSHAVMQEMMALLGSIEGFRPAEAGEFSRRAFYHDKMDLTQAEAIADLIDAETQAQKRQALRQMEGSLSLECERLRQTIIQTRAHLEAHLDFPDEEIPQDVLDSLDAEIRDVRDHITRLLGDSKTGEKIREGYYAVLLGIPNAGKSSLLNALVRRDVAIVSEIAGTTRDVIEVHLDMGGYPLTLADTAGLRSNTENIEAEGIRRALMKAENADFRLVVIDASLPRSRQDLILTHLRPDDVLILNKSDVSPLYVDEFLDLPSPLAISAATGDGMEHLISVLKQRMEERLSGGQTALITRARHRHAFEAALLCLEHALAQETPELKGEELRLASQQLGKIVGAIHIEDVLDVVFSSFCIGK